MTVSHFIGALFTAAFDQAPIDNPARFPQHLLSRGCGARGDLGQLAPRKKLLKSTSSFPEAF